jgi:hypothetical protein
MTSLDYLVGDAEQRRRDREAKQSGTLDVDDKLELGRLLDWQVSRPRAFEDAIHIGAHLPIRIPNIGPVAHQSAGFGNLT